MHSAFASLAPPPRRPENQSLELRGGTFALATIAVHDPDPEAFEAALSAKLDGAGSFEFGTPVVLEFGPSCRASATDPVALVAVARTHGLLPVGFRASEPALDTVALSAGLAKITATPVLDVPAAKRGTLIVDGPVRSGQSVYAAGGDLVVLGAVSGGAELLADGSIHAYGPLRGRALAGVSGDETARVFAAQLSAELVSIAGLYLGADDIPPEAREARVQIRLADGCLRFAPLA